MSIGKHGIHKRSKNIAGRAKGEITRGNRPRIHWIKIEIRLLQQGGLSVVEYYTKWKVLGDKLDDYDVVHVPLL